MTVERGSAGASDAGPAVDPDARRRRRRLLLRVSLALAPAAIGSNTAGGAVVYVYLAFLSPGREVPGDRTGTLVNTVVFLGYLGFGVLVGTVASVVVLTRMRRWLRHGRDPDATDRRDVLRLPARLVRAYGAIWATAVLVFAGLNLNDSSGQALAIALTVTVGGLTTCALSYLLVERLVRPVVAEAMRGVDEAPAVVLGVRRRVLLAWALGSGVPLGGIFIGVVDVGGRGGLETGALLFLSGVGLISGLLCVLFAARSIGDPLEQVSAALRAVSAGDLSVRVPVYDGSEIGQLQNGVNTMVTGLRERARMGDLFGRQVGPDVARLALEQGVRLGGERREAAVLFVDVIGSTALAVQEDPEIVVAHLNAFFGVVVDVMARHGGWVNKFEGDAGLCVFGVPVEQPDCVARALAAARELSVRLDGQELRAAVGVGGGTVVAGHVGAESRFEYTVIGDPVNTAARLSELAKGEPCRVLADQALLSRAGVEAERWEPAGAQVLRGRAAPTSLARPVLPA